MYIFQMQRLTSHFYYHVQLIEYKQVNSEVKTLNKLLFAVFTNTAGKLKKGITGIGVTFPHINKNQAIFFNKLDVEIYFCVEGMVWVPQCISKNE